MKLVIATPLYPPEIGGPATDASAVVACLRDRGVEVEVVPFSAVRSAPKVLRHIQYALKLRNAARGAQAIIAFDTFSVGVPAAMVARSTGIPLVMRVPGDYAWEQGVQRFGVTDTLEAFQTKRYGRSVELFRRAQRFAVRSAALVLAPSDYFASIIRGWGVDAHRVRRIYLGLPLDEAIVAPRNIPEGKILFSSGRLVPWKGFSMLLDLASALPAWKLVIAGDGPDRAKLQMGARDLGLQERVIFLGGIPHAEVLGWLRRADAFVFNTQWESFSFQVLEALAAGAAIITTRVGSLPELITDGVEGVLCQPNDLAAFTRAVESLPGGVHADGEVWKARREAARAKAAAFSIETSASAFADAINELCASSS